MVERMLSMHEARGSIPCSSIFFGLIFIVVCLGSLARTYVRFSQTDIRDSIVASILACHARDPGSIPGLGVFLHPESSSVASGPNFYLRAQGSD